MSVCSDTAHRPYGSSRHYPDAAFWTYCLGDSILSVYTNSTVLRYCTRHLSMWWIWLFWTTINPLLNSGGASYKMIIFRPIVCRPLVFFWFSALFFFGWRLVRTNMRIGTVKGRRREEKGAGRFGWCVFLVEDTHHSLRYGSCPAHIHTTGCAQKNKKRKKERKRESLIMWHERTAPLGFSLAVGCLWGSYPQRILSSIL